MGIKKTKLSFLLPAAITLFVFSLGLAALAAEKTGAKEEKGDSSRITKLLEEAQLFISQAKPEKAKKSLEKARALLPKDAKVLRQIAEAYISLKEKELAQDALMKIILSAEGATSPTREWAHSQYYNAAAGEEGGISGAVKKLEGMAAGEPANTGLGLCIAEGYLRLWEREKAIKIYEDLNKKNPGDKEIFYCLITQYMNQPNYAEMIRRLEPLVKDDPLNSPYTDMLGIAYSGANRIDDFLDLYGRLAKENPVSASARIRYAQALMSVNRLDESVKEWEKAFELDPSNIGIKEVIADIYESSGRKEEAKKIREALGTSPMQQQEGYGRQDEKK